MPLTEMAIRNAKPRDTDYKMADGGGLYLHVTKVSRRWRLKYRWGGKERTMTIGPYPAVGLADARQKRTDAQRALAEGREPGGRVERTGETFETVARAHHANRADTLVPAHARRVLSRMENDVFPAIGNRLLTDIQPADVLAIIRDVEARGAIDVARRLKQSISRVFRFAIAHDWASIDPTANLQDLLKPKPRVRNMPRLPLAQLPEFLTRLDAYRGDELTRLAIRFTLLTWARTNETRFARWDEFDGDRWRVPAERMKMKRDHIVPLSTQARRVVDRLREISASDWVFPQARKPMLAMSQNTMIVALYRMGYASRLTIHGLRGMASTWANEADIYKPDWIEMQLAHNEDDAVRGAYNAAEYITQRVAMMADWGRFVEQQDDEFARLL